MCGASGGVGPAARDLSVLRRRRCRRASYAAGIIAGGSRCPALDRREVRRFEGAGAPRRLAPRRRGSAREGKVLPGARRSVDDRLVDGLLRQPGSRMARSEKARRRRLRDAVRDGDRCVQWQRTRPFVDDRHRHPADDTGSPNRMRCPSGVRMPNSRRPHGSSVGGAITCAPRLANSS